MTGLEQAGLDSVRVKVRLLLPTASLTLDELAGLVPGAILEFDAPAGCPVELVVNGRVLAEGEMVRVGKLRAFVLSELP